jgi:hypothetical protein
MGKRSVLDDPHVPRSGAKKPNRALAKGSASKFKLAPDSCNFCHKTADKVNIEFGWDSDWDAFEILSISSIQF